MIDKMNNNKNANDIKFYLDYDKNKNVFYENLYLCDCKKVLKIPLVNNQNPSHKDKIKIRKFDLEKYVYLVDHS